MLHRCMAQLKKLCPQILKIWRQDSQRGRYQHKWQAWEDTLAEMEHDEKNLVSDEDLRAGFEEVDLDVIAKNKYELHIQ